METMFRQSFDLKTHRAIIIRIRAELDLRRLDLTCPLNNIRIKLPNDHKIEKKPLYLTNCNNLSVNGVQPVYTLVPSTDTPTSGYLPLVWSEHIGSAQLRTIPSPLQHLVGGRSTSIAIGPVTCI